MSVTFLQVQCEYTHTIFVLLAGVNNHLFMYLSSAQRSGRDPRGSDNLSAKSSDSDVSDVSAVSRTSSASRFSSTSYMSVQSERPQGNRKIR